MHTTYTTYNSANMTTPQHLQTLSRRDGGDGVDT